MATAPEKVMVEYVIGDDGYPKAVYTLDEDDSRQSEFGHLAKALISAILVIEIFCIIQFWPA